MDRKQLLRLMPRNQSDSVVAKMMVDLGYPTVKPVLKDMLHCIRTDSEVADIFCEFFAQLGSNVIKIDEKGIEESKDLWLRYGIPNILPRWPIEAITHLKHSVAECATRPDRYNTDLYCIKLLINTQLGDLAWLIELLESKQKCLTNRLDLIKSLQFQMEGGKNGSGKDDNITTD